MHRLFGPTDKMRRLGRIPLFAGCRPDDLRELAAALDEVTVGEDVTLLRPGQRVQEVLVLEQGAVLAVDHRGGHELGPGESFGERELLAGRRASAWVVTKAPSTLFVAEQRAFVGLLERVPVVARRLPRDFATDLPEVPQAARSTPWMAHS